MSQQDPYAGITDLDQATIDAMENTGYLAQFLISNFLFLCIGGAGVGYVIGLVSFHSPAIAVPLAWTGLVLVALSEFFYWLAMYTKAHGGPWMAWLHRYGTRFWRNEFRLIDHTFLGWLPSDSNIPPSADDKIVTLSRIRENIGGKLAPAVEELRFKSKQFPAAVAVMEDILEVCCSFKGSSIVVQEGGFTFSVNDCTAVSFTRKYFIKDNIGRMIPVGVLKDYSKKGMEEGLGTELNLTNRQLIAAGNLHGWHYANQYYNAWMNEKGIRESSAKARQGAGHTVTNEAGEVLKDFSKAHTGLVDQGHQFHAGKTTKWTLLIVALTGIAILGFVLRWW